jgi:hypothetical protein
VTSCGWWVNHLDHSLSSRLLNLYLLNSYWGMGAASRQPHPMRGRPCLIATLIFQNSKMRHATGIMCTSGNGKLFRNSHGFISTVKWSHSVMVSKGDGRFVLSAEVVLIIFSSKELDVNSMCKLRLKNVHFCLVKYSLYCYVLWLKSFDVTHSEVCMTFGGNTTMFIINTLWEMWL